MIKPNPIHLNYISAQYIHGISERVARVFLMHDIDFAPETTSNSNIYCRKHINYNLTYIKNIFIQTLNHEVCY